jgi:hypothetical protein
VRVPGDLGGEQETKIRARRMFERDHADENQLEWKAEIVEPTLYRIVDVFPYLGREDEYPGLTLDEAASRMDDLSGVGADVILSDFAEPCERCEGEGEREHGEPPRPDVCDYCDGDGRWPGPWEWTDPDTGREVTMRREVS